MAKIYLVLLPMSIIDDAAMVLIRELETVLVGFVVFWREAV